MTTTIIFVDGDGHEDRICLEGQVEPQITDALVVFKAENGEQFIVNYGKFVGAYTFIPDEPTQLKLADN